jgi:hypothetical protein
VSRDSLQSSFSAIAKLTSYQRIITMAANAPFPQTPANVAAGFAIEPNPFWIYSDMQDLIDGIDDLEDRMLRDTRHLHLPFTYDDALAWSAQDVIDIRQLLAQCLFQSNSVTQNFQLGENNFLASTYTPLVDRAADPIGWNQVSSRLHVHCQRLIPLGSKQGNGAAVHPNTERNAWRGKARQLHRELAVERFRHEACLAAILARKARKFFDWASTNGFLPFGLTINQLRSEGN